ncbi:MULTISPECIES: GNAT family N-acetyltransferase [Clostridium]|uniref:GNAT family N-acetyltransferase n=1 Tax=Clostridium TaxID=1485 RepID=UPI0008265C06|nr:MULTISPECIES: GNAT family N-acetyltransferase [Clostridium]PJI07137.1 GNAT family N-acetyltransferase [Clostridium sp. CT7]
MFDVDIEFEDISVKNIEREDISDLKSMLKDKKFCLNGNGFDEVFLGYYMSEYEFFTKILKNEEFIGVFRGRIEFKSRNIVWISYFFIDERYSTSKESQNILMNILKYFYNNFGICDFITGITKSEKNMIKMWQNNDFKMIRVNKEFYSDKEYKEDLIIMEKNIS